MKLQNILIVLLFITTVSLGVYCYRLNKLNSQLETSKNFYFKWGSSDEILFSHWNNNKKLANQYIDQNFDNNYEKIIDFTTYGKRIRSSYDTNENGIYERTEIFNSVGDLVGNCWDKDEDGATDKFSLILDDKSELIFLDIDIDGRYEKLILKTENNTSEITIDQLFSN